MQLALSGFGGLVLQPFVQGGITPYRIGVGDLDNDGDRDVVVPNTVSQDLTLFGNDGAGGPAVTATPAVPYLTRGIAVANVIGDWRPDIVTSSIDDPDGATSASLRIFPPATGRRSTVRPRSSSQRRRSSRPSI